MGDNHVCSFCGGSLVGKQHVKVVFENWPVEEEITYRRKGKEIKRTRKVTKEVITCLGMECLQDLDRWKDFDIDPGKVQDFFEDLRFAGKNPNFMAVVQGKIDHCLASNCHQRYIEDGQCCQLIREPFPYTGLDGLRCAVGHPGIVLVRQKEPTINPGSWKSWRQWWRSTPHKGWVALFTLPIVGIWFIMYPVFAFIWIFKRLSLIDVIKARV